VGDCIVALFPRGTDAAVRAAIAMQGEIREYAETQQHAPGRPFSAGMGMHTGSLVMGTIGGDSRLDTGAIGGVMNATSRIEGMTRRYGANLLLSAETLERLENPEALSLREVDTVLVKGKARPLTLHEVLDALPEDVRAAREGSRGRFDAGRAALARGEHAAALEAFEACLQADPTDGAAAWHRERGIDALSAG
jgi:class 3 adenylate cyclase